MCVDYLNIGTPDPGRVLETPTYVTSDEAIGVWGFRDTNSVFIDGTGKHAIVTPSAARFIADMLEDSNDRRRRELAAMLARTAGDVEG